MRRIVLLLASICLVFVLAIPVFGANSASKIQFVAVVNPDESCQVSLTVSLHIETNPGDLKFPIPESASGISINGSSRVSTSRSGNIRYVELSDMVQNMTGDFTLIIQYTLPDVIEASSADIQQLQLPMLSGYEYPISDLSFSVTLPGSFAEKPGFSSGYHQANIEKDLSFSVQGNTVSGQSLTELKDHETLTMTMPVDPALFPNAPLSFFESDADDTAMVICAIVALLYWIFFMRCIPPRRTHTTSAPEGVSAGQLGTVLTLGRPDLSLMVFSWAQLGYLQISVPRAGRVFLTKKMDMGNERTGFEQQCFRGLFGKRDRVDTASLSYALYSKKVAKMRSGVAGYIKPHSGNPKLFRAISAAVALFGGVNFGIAISQGSALQGFWIFVMAVAGLVLGFYTQQTVRELFLIKSRTTYGGLAASAGCLLLGALAGQTGLGMTVVLSQWLAGLLVFYGGRRTDGGKQDYARVLGLRRYLSSVTQDELKRITENDPEYFHSLAPYALALGKDKVFGRRFGKARLPECPYITTGKDSGLTGSDWSKKMRNILSDMKRRSRMLPLEKLMNLFGGIKK